MFQQPQIRLENSVLKFAPVNQFQLIQPGAHDIQQATSGPAASALIQVGQTLAVAPVELLLSLRPVYPLRGFEEWGYPLPQYRATNLERLALPDRAVALASMLASDRKLRKQVSERLQELLGIGLEIELSVGSRVNIYATSDRVNAAETLFANEGTGASQLPFILVPIALAERGETILLSEPEAHLHPKAQSDLTGRIIEIAKKQNLQFFIETHSEHILHKLLHAVARGDRTTNDLAVHYFENVNGLAKVRRLEINDKGQVEGGLPGFFEQSLTEFSEFLDALKKT